MAVFSRILLILLFLTPCTLKAQEITETEIWEFINSEGNYVKFSNQEYLPDIVNDHYRLISKGIKKAGIKESDALIYVDWVKVDSQRLEIPILDINGFISDYKMNNINGFRQRNGLAEDQYLRTVGNASGKDGVLIINLEKGKISEFQLYQ